MVGTIVGDFTNIDQADATTGWLSLGTWAKSYAANNDIHVQNANGIFGQVSASYAWALAATAAGLDLTISSNPHVFFWMKNITWPATASKANGGIRLCISGDVTPTITGTGVNQGPTNSKNWFLGGSDVDITTGWVCYVVDPTGTADLVIGNGNTVMNNIDRAGVGANITGTVGGGSVKPYNIMFDAIKYGTGLTITLGTGVSPVAFTDIFTTDSLNANAFGVATREASIYFIAGKLTFGKTNQAAETVFRDVSQTIVYRDFPVNASFYEIIITGKSTEKTTFRLGNYTPLSNLTSNGCVIKGSGAVSSTSHPIWTLTANAANQVTKLYGGTFSEMRSAALTYNTVSINITNCTTTYPGSATVTTTGSFETSGIVVGMLITGTGIDSATYVKTIESATSLTMNKNATASGTVTLTFSHTNEVRGCTFVNSGAVTSNGCIIDNCVFQDVKTTAPISATYALIIASTTEMSRVSNCTFINCNRAIKITAAGSYDFTNMTFSGNAYDIENAAASGIVTINNDINSNAQTYINTSGATTSIVSSKTLTVTVKDETNNAIQGAQVFINKLTPTIYTAAAGNTAGNTTLIVNETVDTDTPQSGVITVWIKSTNKLLNYSYESWVTKTFTLKTEVTGTANTGGSSTTLKRKTGTSFLTADILEGDTIRNTTDGSWGILDEIVDADTITLFEPLTGGSDNTWQEDDAYSFHKLATTLSNGNDVVRIPIMNRQTNSSGVATRSYTGGTATIRIDVRKSSETTKYQQYTTTGAIISSGLNTTVVMIKDNVA